MANAFTNFLKDFGAGLLGGEGSGDAFMRDYQHADRLYVRNNYARAPKIGFLYFVVFNIDPRAQIADPTWFQKHRRDVGVLVKRADLPKFKISTETLNQYNRKTVIQNKISYSEVTIEFHDDNSDITTGLWKNYYQYYYMDGYGSTTSKNQEFGDTKFNNAKFSYGLDKYQTVPFFTSIDIYVLHKGRGESDFSQVTLVNPLITDWSHDSLTQDDSTKTLTNRMAIMYESVLYRSGKIIKNISPPGFAPVYYDRTPSPLGIGGSGNVFGPGGAIAGIGSIFGENGSLANAQSPLDFLGVALQTKQLVQNIGKITKASAVREGYNIAAGVLSGSIGIGLSQQIVQPQTNVGIVVTPKQQQDATVATPISTTRRE